MLYNSSHSEMFCKKGILKIFAKFAGKHLCWSLLFNKFTRLQSATILRKMIQHGDFPVNSAKFLRTPFFIEHFQWLLLYAAVLSLLSLWRLFLTLLFLKLSDFTYSFSKLNSMNISICFHNSKHDHGEENLIFITKEIHESFRGRKIYLAVF